MKPLLFDHFPKTGGTSVVAVLKTIVGQNNVASVLGESAAAACDKFRNSLAICGHMSFHPGAQLPADRYCLTILRDPIERVLSAYNFFRSNANALVTQSVYFARKFDFENYLSCNDSVVRDEISNAQTNHYFNLGYSGNSGDFGVADFDKLGAAKCALERFNLVGTVNELRDLFDILCFEQNLPPVRFIPKDNTSVRGLKPTDLPRRTLERLRALNELDIELYEHAEYLLRSHRRRIMFSCIDEKVTEGASVPREGVAQRHSTIKVEQIIEDEFDKSASEHIQFGDRGAEIVSVSFLGDIVNCPQILSGEIFNCKVIFVANEDIPDLTVGIVIRDQYKTLTFGTNSRALGFTLSVSRGATYFIDFTGRCDLGIGKYWVGAALHPGSSHVQRCFHWREHVCEFEVVGQLGHHAMGAYKLHPNLNFGCCQPSIGTINSREILDASDGYRILRYHTPALTEFNALIVFSFVDLFDVKSGQSFEVEINITNNGSVCWPSTGLRAVYISYHWLDDNREMVIFDGKRTPLPYDIAAGHKFSTWATIVAPERSGNMLLQLTLVQEHVGWFEENGSTSAETIIEVK